MIFCMPEFAVKTAEGVPGTGNLINCFELRYSTQYLRCCEIACQRSADQRFLDPTIEVMKLLSHVKCSCRN